MPIRIGRKILQVSGQEKVKLVLKCEAVLDSISQDRRRGKKRLLTISRLRVLGGEMEKALLSPVDDDAELVTRESVSDLITRAVDCGADASGMLYVDETVNLMVEYRVEESRARRRNATMKPKNIKG